MLQLIIAGLLILCLLCVGVIWYLVLGFNVERERRRQLERELEELRREQESAKHDNARETPRTEETSRSDGASLASDEERETEEAIHSTDPPQEIEETVTTATEDVDEADIYSLAWSIDDYFNRSSSPKELLLNERFLKGVEILRGDGYTPHDLLNYARGSNVVVACMALEALSEREDGGFVNISLINDLNDLYHWPRHYALRAIAARVYRPVLAEILARVNSTWSEFIPLQSLCEFARQRLALLEYLTLDALLAEFSQRKASEEDVGQAADVIVQMGDALPPGLADELRKWRGESVDLVFLKSFGRVWETAGEGEDEVVLLDAVSSRVLELESAIKEEPARSVLLVGDSGVGKTAIVRAVARKLQAARWTILEASAADVLAGQQYIGQLEERVQTLIRQIGGKRVLWVIPNFQETLWAGRHKYSPVGVLDLLLPHIESGHIKVIGEVPSASFEQLTRLRPKLRTTMQTCRVAPLSDADTLELGRRWAARHAAAPDARQNAGHAALVPRVSEGTLKEAFQLARQYIGDKAAPGNLLVLLDSTERRLATAGERRAGGQITHDDVLVTLSQLTGLPASILDEHEELNLENLRAFFERRVLGQPEAVECLVERVAMIKAGLTDPTRPQGVFLFVGPTGTGKTEIAKTLAEFLFGSPERMIRLDMSELQTAESLNRILGEQNETSDSTALVNSIRKQPFSVVLLDEFEKAHPQVWDLFLQVFDDGRLTDRLGNMADFRHCVVIMTSNLGATLPTGASIGFSQESAQFASGSVERAVMKSFRREFVNRIDRIVVFRPLGLGVMRDLLRKELNDVLNRRGFRTRQWAVEWDESAIEFLLRQGFTADLGARPLKRAIERYLLSPLSMTIVNHQFPEGDQFLFVRSSTDGHALDVRFVDPDATEQQQTGALPPLPIEEETQSTGERELRLESIALDAHGAAEEVRLLQEKFDELAGQVDADDWRQRKADALAQTQTHDFWNSPERFSVLGLAEYMDRIETGLDTAGSLLRRLSGSGPRDRKTFPPDIVGRVAEQLYLLDHASRALASNEPRDAFLLVRAVRETGTDNSTGDDFARRITRMYRRWAEKRRMRLEVLKEGGGAGDNDGKNQHDAGDALHYRALLAVSGFGAYSILQTEAGLHVLETPQDEKSFNRAKVQVRVVAQPDEPAGHGPDSLRRQAERALAADHNGSAPPVVVRRYREQPSPLVRDSARGWRTGKIERVLGGDFDLMS
ncbi:MAG: AAA family ATPase [Acidobacteria bacterium]|nr:AAA family ATPase [Acidobacteriota bacterium]